MSPLLARAGKCQNDHLSDCESGEGERHQADASHAALGIASKSRKKEHGRDCLDRGGNSQSDNPEQNISRHIAQAGWLGGRAGQSDGYSCGQQQGTEPGRYQQWSSRLDSTP